MPLDPLQRARFLLARITPARPVWVGCDGRLRMAHTDDMREMLERLGYSTVA